MSDVDEPPTQTLEEVSREYIVRCLLYHDRNRTHAARTLGISVRTLQRKIRGWKAQRRGLPSELEIWSE